MPHWSEITSDHWALDPILGVLSGTHRNTTKHPPCKHRLSEEHLHLLHKGVQALLDKGGHRTCSTSTRRKGVYSLYFLIPKKGGSLRPFPNLRLLNKYILSEHFHMVTLPDFAPLLQKSDFMTTLDLRDAYTHIPIHPVYRRYLRFVVSDQHYQFKVLSFGVTTAPRVFDKCLAVLAAHLRRSGIHVFPYLDNWLLKSTTQQL